MKKEEREALRRSLQSRKKELSARLERIHDNLRRGLDPDSEERARQLSDSEVVDALGNDARAELEEIAATLARLDNGTFGQCLTCGNAIGSGRLRAYPCAPQCIACAAGEGDRRRNAR
jgi:DnaK suppressor protein